MGAQDDGGVFGGFARGIKAVGGIAKAIGEATGEKDIAEAGEALTRAADEEVPAVRAKLREHLPETLSAAGQVAGRRIFDILDGKAPAVSPEAPGPRRAPFGR